MQLSDFLRYLETSSQDGFYFRPMHCLKREVSLPTPYDGLAKSLGVRLAWNSKCREGILQEAHFAEEEQGPQAFGVQHLLPAPSAQSAMLCLVDSDSRRTQQYHMGSTI